MAGYIGPAPVPQATQNREAFTATSGQTSFATSGYTPQFIDVYLNGVKLAAADYTATNGSDVVLASGAAVGDILEVVAFSAFTVADQAFTGTTTVDNLSVTGAFTSQGIDDNANATAITIDSSENVGIGTASPSTTLDLVGNWVSNTGQLSIDTPSGETYSGLAILNNGSVKGFLYHDNSAGTLDLQTYTTDALRFKTNNTERMRIDSSGNVGIGTNIPSFYSGKLTVAGGNVAIEGGNRALFWNSAGSGVASIQGVGTNELSFSTSNSYTERMRIDSSGNVGIGNISPTDKLHLGTNSGGTQLKIQSGSGVNNCILHTNGTTDSWRTGMNLTLANGSYEFYDDVNNVARMVIDSSGNVGIGDSTPSQKLDVNGNIRVTTGFVEFSGDTSTPSAAAAIHRPADNTLAFSTLNTERMRINSIGNLSLNSNGSLNALDGVAGMQIGNSSAASAGLALETSSRGYLWYVSSSNLKLWDSTANSDRLVIDSSGGVKINNGNLQIERSGSSPLLQFTDTGVNSRWMGLVDGTSNFTIYGTNGSTQELTLDASGNLLVGKTSTNYNVTGVQAFGTGYLHATADISSGGQVVNINRKTSDGELINFRKDGTTVGSIGANGGDLFVGTGDTGVRFVDSLDCLLPFNTSTNATRDAGIDIGYNDGGRFKDLHLSGGVVFGDAGGSGTSTSNSLDSYEEGTWTPALTGSSSQTGQTYSDQAGTYTKVGRQVTCRFRLILTAEGTFTGTYLLLSGFPFAMAATPNAVNGGTLYFTDLGVNVYYVALQMKEGDVKAYLWAKKTLSASREYLANTDLSNTTSLSGTFTYFTA